jgi:hypothetical protein
MTVIERVDIKPIQLENQKIKSVRNFISKYAIIQFCIVSGFTLTNP